MAELLVGTAAAGATATAAATSASTVLTILSGVATAAAVLGHLQEANVNATQSISNAVQSELEAGQSQVASEQRSTVMKRELAKVLGENDVAIAAAGIDLGGGIADTSRAAAKKQTSRELSIERSDDEMRRALLKARAQGYRTQAKSYQAGGLLAAVGDVASFGIDVANRG